MVKSVLGVAHEGLSDWVIQRISAILITIYSLSLIIYLVVHPGLMFAEWHHLFGLTWMKIATILFILCILFHAWIGMWTVFTDYIKAFVVRFILDILVILTLSACFIWAILILWSV